MNTPNMHSSPKSLYSLCIHSVVTDCTSSYKISKKDLRYLPNNVLSDVYYKMFEEKRLCLLATEISDLEIFCRILSVKHQKIRFFKMFQSLINHGTNIPEEIFNSYMYLCGHMEPDLPTLKLGLRIGAFFCDGGFYHHCIKILNLTEIMCNKRCRDISTLRMLLDIYHKRICAESVYCEFRKGANTLESAQKVIAELKELNDVPNVAGLYSNFSLYYFTRSEYNEAFSWSEKALKLIDNSLPSKIIIEVLRQASKSCVVKRKFEPAGLLIGQAVTLGSSLYEIDHDPHFSDTLLDYGFYLLNFDSIQESVMIYQQALKIRKEVFQKNSIHIALGLEDLAYALYVNEYSSGNFYSARDNAERSIRIMERILPENHLLLASVKRVKALILEEIALDERQNNELQKKYLEQAEQLHTAALALSLEAFGTRNVQTAKHYGNLGRLYQSMKRYSEAEAMHLQAIAIKEELLGIDDYEVGLSTGHLASLYNYHMKRHKDAERLYLRSIDINLKLFGAAYSGLEYDYRGLVNVYTKLIDVPKMVLYTGKMREWKGLRERLRPHANAGELMPLTEVVNEFFRMCG